MCCNGICIYIYFFFFFWEIVMELWGPIDGIIKHMGKFQLTHLWFDRNLSCLPVVWNLTLYPLEIWSKFKLTIYGLKFRVASISLDSFWSCIFIFVFLEERDIKVEKNDIFSPLFNRDRLQNSNWVNLRWVKCRISNHR